MDEHDDKLELSSGALAALQEFYSEKDTQQRRFEDLKAASESKAQLSMDMFTEDWNASQFWYSDETARTLALEILQGADDTMSIAVVSAPSVFVQLKNLVASNVTNSGAVDSSPKLYLLEFDERFSVLDGFVRYDFNSPIMLPPDMKGKFDRIICDPPFLSADCQTKVGMTARWLSKANTGAPQSEVKVLVCTGERMQDLIHKLYPGVKTTTFIPKHAQDRLSNEFRSYANFDGRAWQLIEP